MKKRLCSRCGVSAAALKRPKNAALLCQNCFFVVFEDEVHQTIQRQSMFAAGETVALGASGGKDSTVLMHLMSSLNRRYQYGLNLILVSIDEGIVGYRDDSLKTVNRNSDFYQLPLHILTYKQLFGWTMDEIVQKIGSKSNCTYCGVFRRQALERGAALVGATKIVTGHNADDNAETILMNFLRADVARLSRAGAPTTEGESVPRVKPLEDAYEKEIVLYAHFNKLDYFTTECTYSKEAFRGNARSLLKELEGIKSSVISDIVFSGEGIRFPSSVQSLPLQKCRNCGHVSSHPQCRACGLVETLQRL